MALSDVAQRIKELESKKVQAGWFSGKYGSGIDVAQVAVIQEFGTKSIPPRPFLRPTFSKENSNWEAVAGKLVKPVIDGELSVDGLYTEVGSLMEGDVFKTIANISDPPLTDTTILLRKWRKEGRTITGKTVGEAYQEVHSDDPPDLGSDNKPLNDSGLMIATLTHAVVNV